MDYDLEEQEQLAAIKAWWNQYGKLVIVTVVGGLLVVGGIRGWHYYRNTQAASAQGSRRQADASACPQK